MLAEGAVLLALVNPIHPERVRVVASAASNDRKATILPGLDKPCCFAWIRLCF